jgi:1,4-alpha-glucan branching enzyme
MSLAYATQHHWNDQAWMDSRNERNKIDKPISVYQVHAPSWMRVPEESNRALTISELASRLSSYARQMNFTHVELIECEGFSHDDALPDWLDLVDRFHRENVGVIISPARFEDHGSFIERLRESHVDGVGGRNSIFMFDQEGGFELRRETSWASTLLNYLGKETDERRLFHDFLTARTPPRSAFVLPLSSEDVLPGRKSLVQKFPGDDWQRFANLRLLFAHQYAQPGKKLLFMGDEFGQWNEWNRYESLDWHLIQPRSFYEGTKRWVADLNHLYRREPAFHQTDANPQGFDWGDRTDSEKSLISWVRHSATTGETIVAAFNFTPTPRHNYRVGVPGGGYWLEVLNSDAEDYGGSGQGNLGGVEAAPFGWHFKSHSLTVTLPPLGAVFFKQM